MSRNRTCTRLSNRTSRCHIHSTITRLRRAARDPMPCSFVHISTNSASVHGTVSSPSSMPFSISGDNKHKHKYEGA
jgi:hypothetical protein